MLDGEVQSNSCNIILKHDFKVQNPKMESKLFPEPACGRMNLESGF